MPLNPTNVRTFHRWMYAGWLEPLKLYKRGDDQEMGTVRTVILEECRRSAIGKTGENIQGDNVVGHTTIWHIPIDQLEENGIEYLSNADRLEQIEPPLTRDAEIGSVWEPEATTTFEKKLGGTHVCVNCLRTDPPNAA